jgi:hypothetical protein
MAGLDPAIHEKEKAGSNPGLFLCGTALFHPPDVIIRESG